MEQKEVKGEEVLSHYTYTYDGYGNITAIEGTEVTATEEGISQLVSAAMTYDAGNRLLTYNGEALQYDADGNMTYGPVDGVMSELVYDCRSRLISAGGVTYTYDAENNRISAETDKYVEEYVTDTVSASLSRVLTMTVYEKTAGKAETAGTTTTYLYGQGLISEQTGDLYLYHHYNHLGSTMLLTDGEGNVVETYTYGVYGELLSGDTTLTRFLYNGRCGVSTDDNGLYYMRQRYYNPEIKRFVNQDILAGSLGNSQSLNRYSYVQGNPVSYTDPFGLSPSGGLFSNTNFAHSFFGILSCVPGIVGACASLADGLVYALVDKDYAMAGLCALDVVSMGLGKFATNLIKGQKMTNTGVALYRSAKLMSNASSFGQNAIALNQNVGTILEKWDSGVSASGTDFLALGMSVFGCAISGGGILHDVGQIRQMRSDADFMKGLKSELGQFGNGIKTSFANFMNNNGGYFDLSFFTGGNATNDYKILYRGDNLSTDPESIFVEGFRPKGSHNDALIHNQFGARPGNFVSTSERLEVANDFATFEGIQGGYVYKIYTNNFIDMNATYGKDVAYPHDYEFLIPGGIKPSEIVGAYRIERDYSIGDFIYNPNYGGNE